MRTPFNLKSVKSRRTLALFASIILLAVACTKEESRPVEPERVVANDGLTIKNGQEFKLLENTEIENVNVLDTTFIDGHAFINYDLELSGDQVDDVKPGSIIINTEGMGSLILITEVGEITKKSASGSASTQSLLAIGVSATLDLLFNYEGAILKFSTKPNRTKTNADIPGMLFEEQIADDKDKFEMDTDGEQGLSYTTDNSLVKFALNGTKFKLKPKDGHAEASASLTIKEGYISVNPALDFMVEYNPKYIKYSDNAWVNFANYLNIPKQVTDKTLAVGTLKQLKTILYADLDYGIDLELNITGKLKEEIFEKKIAQWCMVFFAGPVPIGRQTTISFEVDASVAGSVTARAWYKQQNDIILGLDLKNNLTDAGELDTEIDYYNVMKTVTDKGVTLTAQVEVAAGITLKYKEEIYIAGVLGPSGAAGAKVEARASFWNYPSPYSHVNGWDMGVDASLFAEASLDLSLFHIDKATWKFLASKPWELANWNLYHYPDKLEIVTGSPQTGQAGKVLDEPIQLEVQDNYGNSYSSDFLQVPVFFRGGEFPDFNGNVPSSPVRSVGGFVSTDWTLGPDLGTQRLQVSFLGSDGEPMGDPFVVEALAEQAEAPIILQTNPANGAPGVDVETPIEITYSEEVFFTSGNGMSSLEGSIARLEDSQGGLVSFSAQISGNQVILVPDLSLTYGETYTLTVYGDVVHDAYGTYASGSDEAIQFSTLDDTGITVDIKEILTEEILEIIEEMDIDINGGNNPPNVEATYLVTPYLLYKSNITNDVIGNQYGDLVIQFYDQNTEDLSVKTASTQASTIGEGKGSFIVGDGNLFTVVGEDIRYESDGTTLRCKLAFIVSGEVAEGGIKDLHRTIVMVDDYGDPNNNMIEIGQLRELHDGDGFSEITDDLQKGAFIFDLNGADEVED